MAAPNEITAQQLNRLIGTPDAPLIADQRVDEDFAPDPRMIPGAVRHDFRDLSGLARRVERTPGRSVVIVCQKGRKISQGTAALLRQDGVATEVLEGGWLAWTGAGLPTVHVGLELPRDGAGRTLWVTRHRPKIDRIACPWLIRRFIDPEAKFLFVPPQDVQAVAEKFGATPFDIEGVRFSHRGELCSFDVILSEFGLVSEPLDRLARVVRGADTDRHDLAPQAAGLLALSVGLSRMFSDDSRQLEAGMTFYDALYRWARDGVDEGHTWPSASVRP